MNLLPITRQVLILALAQNYKEMIMDNVTFIKVNTLEGEVEHAIIDRGNGEFTSMTKAHYEELEAAKAIGADEAKTK